MAMSHGEHADKGHIGYGTKTTERQSQAPQYVFVVLQCQQCQSCCTTHAPHEVAVAAHAGLMETDTHQIDAIQE